MYCQSHAFGEEGLPGFSFQRHLGELYDIMIGLYGVTTSASMFLKASLQILVCRVYMLQYLMV